MVDTLVTNIKEKKKQQQKDDVECQVNDSFFPNLLLLFCMVFMGECHVNDDAISLMYE